MKTIKDRIVEVVIIAVIVFTSFIIYFVPFKSILTGNNANNLAAFHVLASEFVPTDLNKELVKRQSRLLVVEKLHAKMLDNDRSLHIYLPPGYYKDTEKRFPVLYVHDGKSVFDISDWSKESLNMHTTADKLISEDKIKEIIIVGIDNIGEMRASEYSHWDGIDMGKPVKSRGLLYEDFVINDVKPFIDKNFRTLADRDNTALMGASIGGLATFNIGYRHSEVFSKLAMLSPYLGWGDNRLYSMISQGIYKDKKPLKMWIDVGSKEDGFIDMAANGVALLFNNGYKYLDELAAYEAPEGEHSERFWAQRVEPILIYFYGDIGKPKTVELFMDNQVSISEYQTRHINAVLTYDSGFKMTDVFGSYEVEKAEVLKIEPLGGALKPLAEGTTKINFTSSKGLVVNDEIKVVK